MFKSTAGLDVFFWKKMVWEMDWNLDMNSSILGTVVPDNQRRDSRSYYALYDGLI